MVCSLSIIILVPRVDQEFGVKLRRNRVTKEIAHCYFRTVDLQLNDIANQFSILGTVLLYTWLDY